MSLRRFLKKKQNYVAFRNEDGCTKFIFITKLRPLDAVEEKPRFISSISDKKGRLSCYVVIHVQRKLRQVYKTELHFFPISFIRNSITMFYTSLCGSLSDVCMH